MRGREMYDRGAEGLGVLFTRPVRVREALHARGEVGVAVSKLR